MHSIWRSRNCFAMLLAIAFASLAGSPHSLMAGEGKERVTRLDLTDTNGKVRQLDEWKASKLIVLIFVGTTCPISNGYAPEYRRLFEEFSAKGVTFLGIHPDADVDAKLAAKHAEDYKLTMPILLDPEQRVANDAGVSATPEAVVLSPKGEILYRGRIDDKYLAAGPGRRRLEAKERTLAVAIEGLLEGKKPAESRTKAHGCPLPEISK